jgi:DNA-binding transcriptional ArsR family regulator
MDNVASLVYEFERVYEMVDEAGMQGTIQGNFDEAELKMIARFMGALSDPVRLRLLYLLGDQGRRNVGELAGNFHLSRPAISHHLKVLKDAGLLDSEKVGQEVYYRLERERIVTILRDLADQAAMWHGEP